MMDDYSEYILNTHIAIAILAVICGTMSVLSKKSKLFHKTFGKVYVIAILATAASAFILMMIPDYRNSIMFLIGLFNVYFAVSGYRSLKLKIVFTSDNVSSLDKGISTSMFFVAVVMFYHGIYSIREGDMWGYILVLYSIFGFVNVYRDFKLFTTKQFGTFSWMEFHSSKMIGSYVGAITAVCVTQLHEYLGIITWFVPSVFGIMYMTYWIKRIRENPESVFG